MAGEENLINSLASFSAPMSGPAPVAATQAMPLSLTEQKAPAPDLVEQKKAAISQNSEAKQLNIGGPEALMQRVVAQDQGISQAPVANEFSPEGQLELARIAEARQRVRALERAPRTMNQVVGDTALGVIGGFGRTAEGLGALNTTALDALDVDNPLLRAGGVGLEGIGGFIADTADSFKSDGLQAAKQLSQMEQAARAEQSRETYEAALESGESPMNAGLARVGRDAISAIQAAGDNPATALDMVAENVPSLVVSASGGAALAREAIKRNLISKGATDDVAERFLATDRGQSLIRETSIKMQPAMSGAQEAGGAAAEAGQKIDEMTNEQLQENSPEYRSLLETMTPEEAKAEIRSRVTQDSALASGIIGTALGNVTKTFDAAPFATTGIANTVKNVVGENFEEGAMGAGGTLAQNETIRKNADETQDVLEDVGKSVGEGMVAATGLSATTQTPGVLMQGGKAILDKTVKVTTNAIKKVADYNAAQANADSVNSPEAVAARDTEVTKAAETIEEIVAPKPVDTPVEAPVEGEAPTEAAPAEPVAENPVFKKMKDTYRVPDEEYISMSDNILEVVKDPNNELPKTREGVMRNLTSVFAEVPDDMTDLKTEMATEIVRNLERLESLNNDEVNNYLAEAKDEKLNGAYDVISTTAAKFRSDKQVNNAIEYLRKQNIESTTVTEANVNTPEAVKEVDTIVATATVNPMAVKSDVIKTVLDLSRKREVQLSDENVQALESAADMSDIVTLYSDNRAEINNATSKGRVNAQTGANMNADTVSDQIIRTGWETERNSSRPSVVQNALKTQELVRTGRFDEAAASATGIKNLAITLNNKLGALDASSKEKGAKKSYRAFVPETNEWIDTAQRGDDAEVYGNAFIGISPNENSYNFYRRVFNDASASTAMYNTLASKYPELNLDPLPMPKLSQSITQNQRLFGNKKGLEALAAFQSVTFTPATRNIPQAPEGSQGVDIEPLTVDAPVVERGPRKVGGMSDAAIKDSPAKVTLKGKDNATQYIVKDQKKADKSNKFIGRGSDNSSTKRYAEAYGEDANTGQYEATDTVFISSEGNRKGRVEPDFAEIQKAIDAGVTFITDKVADRNTNYNVGERQVAEYLGKNGYEESSDGTWTPAKAAQPGPRKTGGMSDAQIKAEEAKPVEVEKPKRDLAKRFEKVYKGEFGKLFEPRETRSPLVDNDEPLNTTKKLLREKPPSTGRSLVGNKLLGLAPQIIQRYTDNLSQALKSDMVVKSLEKNQAQPEDYANLRSVIFSETDADGNLVMNKQIIETAVLAALSQVANLGAKGKVNVVDALEKQGISFEGVPDAGLVKFITETTPTYQIVDAISRDTMNMLGIKPAANVSEAQSKAAIDAMSHEILYQLKEMDILDSVSMTISSDADLADNPVIYISANKDQKAIQKKLQSFGTVQSSNGSVKFKRVTDKAGLAKFLAHPKVRENVTVYTGPIHNLTGMMFNPNFLTEAEKKLMAKNSDMLSNLIDPDAAPLFHFEPVGEADMARNLSGSNIRNTPIQNDAIKNSNRIAFTPNAKLLGLGSLLGADQLDEDLSNNVMARIMGYREITDEQKATYNVADLLSIEGKNNSILTELREVNTAVERIIERGEDFESTKLYFPTRFTKSGRPMLVGQANGQANKYARSMLRSTWATLDMNKDNHKEGFWRSIMQMSGVRLDGKKLEYTDIGNIDEFAEKVRDTVYGTKNNGVSYASVIAEMREALNDGEPDLSIIEKGLTGQPVVVMETLYALAQLEQAMEDGTEGSFRHSVPLESDGVTNGPANVLIKFSADAFTAEQLAQFQRVGYFPSNESKALHNREVKNDTYENASEKAVVRINIQQKTLDTPITRENRDRVNRFMGKYAPKGIRVKDDNTAINGVVENNLQQAISKLWELTRDAAKNPLTKTTYGAGKKGTARGITSDVLDKFYQNLTAYMQSEDTGSFEDSPYGYPGVLDDLNALSTSHINMVNKKYVVTRPVGAFVIGMDKQDFTNMMLNNMAFESMAENINHVYVEPLYDAIVEEMGSSFDTMQQFIRATQIQSLVLKALYNRFIKGYADKTIYSPAERKAWEERFKRMGAYIETGDQTFFVGGGTDGFVPAENGSTRRLAGSINNAKGRLSTGFRGLVPTLAGVSAGAYINIGTGDGLMMTTALAKMTSEVVDILHIYDGMEMPADKIKEIGALMNEAAFNAWQTDTAKDVLNAFENFARNFSEEITNPNGVFDTEMELEILNGMFPYVARNTRRDENREPTLADFQEMGGVDNLIYGMLEGYEGSRGKFYKGLRSTSAMITARLKAMKDVPSSNDQMAGANAPHLNVGRKGLVVPADLEGQAKLLEERRMRYMPEAVKAKAKARTADTNSKLINAINKASSTVGSVREITVEQLGNMTELMSPQEKAFYNDILKAGIADDVQVLFGPAADLEAMYQSRFKTRNRAIKRTPLTEDVSGQYDPTNRVLMLVEEKAGTLGETILHELTHAAIADKIEAYFNGGAITPVQKDAVERLIVLTEDFLNLNFVMDDKRVKTAVQALRAKREETGVNSELVNEVIAEILTNPDLVKVSKQTKVMNPLLNVIVKAIKAVSDMFKGLRNPGTSYFSNAAFNAQILSLSTMPDDDGGSDTVFNKIDPTSPKGRETSAAIKATVDRAVMAKGMNKPLFAAQVGKTVAAVSDIALRDIQKAGFKLNAEEGIVFRQIYELFAVENGKINGSALVRSQEVFTKVLQELTVESFEPTSSSRLEAQDKYNLVTGLTARNPRDSRGLAMAMGSFLALAASNQELSDILKTIQAPQSEALSYNSTDEILSSITQKGLDLFQSLTVGENIGKNAQEAIDNLVGRLANLEANKQTLIERQYQDAISYVDDKVGQSATYVAEAAIQRIDAAMASVKAPIVRAPLALFKAAAAVFSEKEGTKLADSWTTALNVAKVPNMAVELLAEFRQRTMDNASLYDMINKVRASISAIREEFREQYPKLIEGKFTRKLTQADKAAMHKGIGQTDLAGLLGSFTLREVTRLATSQAYRTNKINQLSNGLNQKQISQAKALADYMVNDKPSFMMKMNAYAIANGDTTIEAQIDNLVSLMAVDAMPADQRDTLGQLFNTETAGMEFALKQMQFYRKTEYSKYQNNDIVRWNQLKGYFPAEGAAGVNVTLQDNIEHDKLVHMGYERVRSYGGSSADYQSGSMSYYRTTVSSRNPYTQGTVQTVQASQNGIDIRTGRMVNGRVDGTITGPYLKTVLARMQTNQRTASDDHLIPVYNAKGNIIALQRAMPADIMALKGRNDDFGRMLGAMAGRQIEEAKALEFNQEITNIMKEMYDNDIGRHDEYINLATSKDPVHKDTWNNIPRDMKDMLTKAFGGPNMFPIRRDNIALAVGYRNAGPSDIWTGVSRIPEHIREDIVKFTNQVFGRKAYTAIANASKVWTGAVSEAKTIIVVKSVIVPFFNLASNVLQLTARGVPMRTIMAGGASKFNEINQYLMNQERGIELQAELRVATLPNEINKLRIELENIKSVNRRMTIWPLIEAGEFKTISEGLNELDVSLKNGKFFEWVEGQVEKLPEGARTVGRYAVVSKSTSLYKGLNRATQYGDFIAKAILYDDMTIRQKKNHADTMATVTQEFVNYDVPAGRSRTFLENFGLFWFPAYKIRSLKPALSNIRENPLRAFMAFNMSEQFGFMGSTVSDNMASVIMDGRITNALGPHMLFRAPTLNPWVNLANG